jgi:hypothetical protein
MDEEWQFCVPYSLFWYVNGSFTCRKILRHGTSGFTSHPKEGVLRSSIASAGFEPATLGPSDKHTNHYTNFNRDTCKACVLYVQVLIYQYGQWNGNDSIVSRTMVKNSWYCTSDSSPFRTEFSTCFMLGVSVVLYAYGNLFSREYISICSMWVCGRI